MLTYHANNLDKALHCQSQVFEPDVLEVERVTSLNVRTGTAASHSNTCRDLYYHQFFKACLTRILSKADGN